MSEHVDREAARRWLDALPGSQIGEVLEQRWASFAEHGAPVVTLYGSYDTGKSSLLRRLLIEAGQEVPAWLTISARHETFEVNEIPVAGCVLRDTPGFVPAGTDVLAKLNTSTAAVAIALTDVAIIVVPPQLATAEYPVLQELVQQDWPPESLWFVISRFDEAGVDPDSDPDGYRELGGRKVRELRSALGLDETVPVYVVSQDFAQMAGAERNPDPIIWDDTREWDGISELLTAISNLGAAGVGAFRASAAQRFWRSAVEQALGQLRAELERCLGNIAVSDEGGQRRASWLGQLDTLTRAAEADLRGRVSAAVGDAMDSPDALSGFADALKTSTGAWYSACERDVDKLLRNVGEIAASDRTRPDWRRFDDLTAALRGPSTDSDGSSPESLIYAPVVRQVGDAVLAALRYYERDRGLKQPRAAIGAGAAPAGVDRMAAAAAGLGLIAELAGIAEQFHNKQRAAAQRTELQTDLTAAGKQAIAIALEALAGLADQTRQQILDATADQADLRDSLHRLAAELRSQISSGAALLAG